MTSSLARGGVFCLIEKLRSLLNKKSSGQDAHAARDFELFDKERKWV